MYTNHMIFSWKNLKNLVFYRFLYWFFSFFPFFVFGYLWPESYPGRLPGIARALVWPRDIHGTSSIARVLKSQTKFQKLVPKSHFASPPDAAPHRVLVALEGLLSGFDLRSSWCPRRCRGPAPLVPWVSQGCPRVTPTTWRCREGGRESSPVTNRQIQKTTKN